MLHTYEIHHPYDPPERYRSSFGDFGKAIDSKRFREVRKDSSVLSQDELDALIGLYDGEIRYTDDALRSMFGELRAMGFLDNCLVVITSDHGEEFGEHGHLDHLGLLYDELLHIPLILVGDSVPRGKVDERLVSTVDVLPTILGYVRIEVQHSLEGRDLWLFRVLSGRRSQIEFPTVEVDGVDEVLLIAETARRGLDPLNP